jgi:hypothetical protein
MDLGPCNQADPEAFFPEKGDSNMEAKRVCWTSCEVRELCLEYALQRDERWGIWGGRSEHERRRIKRGEVLKPFVKPESKARECSGCKHSFIPKRHTQKYCSKGCAKTSEYEGRTARNRKLRNCMHCGSEFESSYSMYCSKECRAQGRVKNVLPGSPVCDWCGDDFEPVHHKQRYCCAEHKRESRKVQWRAFSQKLRDAEAVQP